MMATRYAAAVRVYGLTGNIGSGKSTVARLLRDGGAAVIDADQIAREVVEPGTAGLAQVAARFPGVLDAAGHLDRKALGARVFADDSERRALNGILHPLIAAEAARRVAALSDMGVPFAIYEAALIVENGLDAALDGLIVVTAPEDEQVRRVVLRDGLAEAETRARIAAQLPAAQKAARADFVIENHGPVDALAAQVDRVLAALHSGYSRNRSP
jgi:dephospho-CoA kinase